MKRLIFFIFVLIGFTTTAQRIQNFYGIVSGTSVGLRFTITKGPQCSGYTIFHSIDSVNFIQIYDYPGICGDVSVNQDISYTHTSPTLNQTNYYKVELVPYEVSPILRVYVADQPKKQMLVFPNPVSNSYDVLGVKIFNVSNTRVIGFLYNQFGKPLREYDLVTTLDMTAINVYDLANGLYVLWLTDGNQAFASKFVVNR
ncbi:MAG: hypothetical protein JWO32_1508 [Bacteroidetes bacterium]|nr:hypothetical protein [Bacteroidota bacterium]